MNIYRRIAMAVLSGVALLGTTVQAQTPAVPLKIWTMRTAFKLPVKIDEKDRGNLDKVELYVKDGNEPWTCRDTAPPTQTAFTYHVQHDGEYWFSVVTLDKSGKSSPADLNKEQPGLIVIVDTQPPDVDVRPTTMASGETALKCVVQDANPDPSKVKLEYRTDAGWVTLEAIADQPGLFRVPDPSLKGLVRATATDRAGNTTTREISLLAAKPATPAETSVAAGPTVEMRVDKPMEPSLPPALATPPAMPPTHTSVAANLQLINSNHASLDYQIDDLGPSGVGKVEVWMTRDEGQTWQRLCEDTNRHSPVAIDLPGDGVYGISLVATNGHGNGGTAPAKGDVPNWWVEVDTTKPAAAAGRPRRDRRRLQHDPHQLDRRRQEPETRTGGPLLQHAEGRRLAAHRQGHHQHRHLPVGDAPGDRPGDLRAHGSERPSRQRGPLRCHSAGGAGLLASQGARARHLREQRRGHVSLRQLRRRGWLKE